ncbi:MAG: PAS domain-containing protein, partial [Clostridiaceae bacterium]
MVRYTLKKAWEKPFLSCKDSIVCEVNEEFVVLSGFEKDELIGKSINEIYVMLRMESQVNPEIAENKYSCYMFTKELEPREVVVSCKDSECENEKKYFFKEIPNSRIEDRLPYVEKILSSDKAGVAILSYPDLIQIKANQKILDLLPAPYNEKKYSIGYNLEDILPGGYRGSYLENVITDVVRNKEVFNSDCYKVEINEKETRYYDLSYVPVCISGKVKYIVHTSVDVTEKIQNRKLVEEKNRQIEAIIENIPDGLYTFDKELNVQLLNSSIKELIYESQPFSKLFDLAEHTKYYDSEGNLLETKNLPQLRILNGEKLNDFRITSHRPDRIIHFSLSGSPIYDKDGNIEKALICVRDITEQVNKDELIKQQKQELEAIIENISDGVVLVDNDNNQHLLNSSAKEYIYESDIIRSVDDVLSYAKFYGSDGNLLQREALPVSKVLKGEKIKGFRLTSNRPDGIYHFAISGSPIYDKDGNIEKALICIRDITDLIKSQQAILSKKQYDLLSSMVENLGLEYSRISYPEFKLKYINSKSYNNFKLMDKSIVSPTSVIGRNVFELFNCRPCDIDMIKANIKDIVDKKSSSCFFYNRHIKAGEEKFLKVMLQPLFNMNDEVTEIVSIAIDITDEVNARNEVEEALKVQDEIFANVAHELKTPLNVIFSTNQLMELYLKSDSL